MFGCSDVYHWMGLTAKAICLPDCGLRAKLSACGVHVRFQLKFKSNRMQITTNVCELSFALPKI